MSFFTFLIFLFGLVATCAIADGATLAGGCFVLAAIVLAVLSAFTHAPEIPDDDE